MICFFSHREMETLVIFVPQAITGETSIKIKGLKAYVVGEVDYVFGSWKKFVILHIIGYVLNFLKYS